ncbi:MAG: SET domain-containing protein-lysine N-methyltransferase [Patescibacteria group bacterium]|jgi:hypothetical protein
MDNNFIVKQNNKGFGVYTKRAYKNSQIICQMSGQEKSLKDLILSNGYEFENSIIDPLQIGERAYVAMEKPYSLINHSCDPNSAIVGINTLVALKDIKKGEELTYDYSTTIDESFNCKCGSKKCRKAVSDFFALSEKIQKFYISKKAVPDFILRKYNRLHGFLPKSLRIGIVSGMHNTEKMIEVKSKLIKLGHDAFVTNLAKAFIGKSDKQKERIQLEQKFNQDAIREFWRLMQDADAVLVLNLDKGGIKNYIGGNTLMEIGFAHVLNQKIFLYNPIPEIAYYKTEIQAVKPIIINGNLKKIK